LTAARRAPYAIQKKMSDVLAPYTAAAVCDFCACLRLDKCELEPYKVYNCLWDLVSRPDRINRDVASAKPALRNALRAVAPGRKINLGIPASYMGLWNKLTRDTDREIGLLFILREDTRLDEKHPHVMRVLEEPRVGAVVAHNVMMAHPKLQWMPLGVCDELSTNCWVSDMCSIRTAHIPAERLLYVNFTVITNKDHRSRVAHALKTNGFGMTQIVSREEFVRIMGTFAFCASPDGRGKDCFRTWEAISRGCTPLLDDWPYVRAVAPWLPVVWIGAPAHGAEAAAASVASAAAAAPETATAASIGCESFYLSLPSWEHVTSESLRALAPLAAWRMKRAGSAFLSKSIWLDILRTSPLPREPLISVAKKMADVQSALSKRMCTE
jgi:hypothetical protein